MEMGRSRQCARDRLNKGAWTSNEDKILTDYVKVHGEGKWSNVAKKTDLKRCGKSCRLRWKNYLKPDIKRGNISHDEEELIIRLHKLLGNRWSLIAGRLPGRTDNEIKNYWNSTLAKRAKDFNLKVFTPIIGNVNEAPRTTGKAITLTSSAVLVDTAAQSDQNQYSNVSIGPSPENYLSRKMDLKVFTPIIGNVNEAPRTTGKAITLTSPAVLVDTAAQSDQNQYSNVSIGPSPENYLSRKMESKVTDESPSSLPKFNDHDNIVTDFFMGFDVDDLFKFLDTDINMKTNDDKVCLNGGGDDGDGDSFSLKKFAEANMESSLDFQPLASSFLEQAEEWPPIN